MRFANLMGRATLVDGSGAGLDVEKASDGRFPAEPQSLFAQWDEFRQWAAAQDGRADLAVDPADLHAPTPFPRQVFAIGLNYRSHAAESGLAVPPVPAVFTKFPTCVVNANETVALPSAYVDWEVELVVAIGRRAQAVAEQEAWQHIAGLMVGQDLSERLVQLAGPVPQFSVGRSYPGFGPVGPVLVTPDEFADPNDLELGCRLGDEVLQSGRTGDLIFAVPELIARLSAVCPLLPADLIFTGTPAGVGGARDPKRFLEPGDCRAPE
ncbi:2-keto-4-pentenoate hydratase/2-oxohepta-3-ene-1,7-dioic acid hydratase in catechol pathway [Micromonospora kangleipakensis]|uniref:2-keto-4-pentenoate hydratase/2-oxohepta-3-ene-1,7-dioic acid hydratase in catechol pathway n=1 Tax=Micromonospora kangleipakensis TaxID=1077942 RepID=A0A4V2GD88_9ACTN|nr:fumarylacetoacetate hydrolase family protein [Micromonospora kangleipakensis]RZU74936.1 2-keto-4-pentenoate hydratase/2-oxohepta-3-ene-1,7-dioic acid hydratase in catechol pathway [Micromonospora kangleipakensis]